jgi:enoyl-[acyl-carrier-protein] reductase (NADH)
VRRKPDLVSGAAACWRRIGSMGSIVARRDAGSCDVAKASLEAWTAGVAATLVFLASPQAGHVTGRVIYVSGGA